MPKHATRTSFSKENPRPGPGRKKMTDQEKREARLRRAVEYDYKKELAALFPIAIDQLAKALDKGEFKKGDRLRAVEMIRDTLHGKPAQTFQSPGGGPLIGSFTVMLQQIDGAKVEKL